MRCCRVAYECKRSDVPGEMRIQKLLGSAETEPENESSGDNDCGDKQGKKESTLARRK